MAIARQINRGQLKREKIRELKDLILSKYPDAKFVVARVPDTERTTALLTYTTAEWEELNDLVVDFEFFTMADHDIHILTIPRPIEAWEG